MCQICAKTSNCFTPAIQFTWNDGVLLNYKQKKKHDTPIVTEVVLPFLLRVKLLQTLADLE